MNTFEIKRVLIFYLPTILVAAPQDDTYFIVFIRDDFSFDKVKRSSQYLLNIWLLICAIMWVHLLHLAVAVDQKDNSISLFFHIVDFLRI